MAVVYTMICTCISPCLYSRAADWNLTAPDWKGRLRIVSLGEKCIVKLEDKISGLGQCPVYGYGCPDFSGGTALCIYIFM